ncbi:MAG: hypothetical protein P8Y45_19940 [Exilibacterium sp.]
MDADSIPTRQMLAVKHVLPKHVALANASAGTGAIEGGLRGFHHTEAVNAGEANIDKAAAVLIDVEEAQFDVYFLYPFCSRP